MSASLHTQCLVIRTCLRGDLIFWVDQRLEAQLVLSSDNRFASLQHSLTWQFACQVLGIRSLAVLSPCRILDSIDDDTFSMRDRDSGKLSSCTQAQPSTSGSGLPVYVMLPLDTVWLVERDGKQVGGYPPLVCGHHSSGGQCLLACVAPVLFQILRL